MSYNATNNETTITCPYQLDEQMVVVGAEVAPDFGARYTSTTSNNTVTVTYPNHGFITGDYVDGTLPGPNLSNFAILETDLDAIRLFANAGNVAQHGGFGISDFFIITVIDANTFSFTTSSNAGNNTDNICVMKLYPVFTDSTGTLRESIAGHVFTTFQHDLGGNQNIVAPGDLRHARFIIGEPYNMQYRFANQRLTESQGQGNELISGRLQLKHLYLKFEDTGFMKVTVQPQDNTYSITRGGGIGSDPLQLNSTYEFTSLLGTTKEEKTAILKTGTFKVPVMTRADTVTIDVTNDTYLPTNLTSAEYEAFFYIRSNRR